MSFVTIIVTKNVNEILDNKIVLLAIGAGLTLIAQLAIQRFVVPRVERKKRREDRWERDILALGELLTSELPSLAREARVNVSVMISTRKYVESSYKDGVPKELGGRLEEVEKKANEAVSAFYEFSHIRIRWLVSRIASIQPESREMKNLQRLQQAYWLTVARISMFDGHRDELDEDEIEKLWKEEQNITNLLTKEVERLAFALDVPRAPILGKSRQVYRQAIGPLSRQKKNKGKG
ncbi:hypothetical protein [Actinomadura montaniterrae]|uniref:Uncharacterized protein n=1 Tax=Actinomadura montaniterrae TaxID=1803903 RepID=A0A6L3VV73_9ACTN|nr:hypothetical protein [Actinomadura montaniterrae]KAB2380668.1 hypothetical protein F9B16_17360 [Actinomadura montaniterrae]